MAKKKNSIHDKDKFVVLGCRRLGRTALSIMRAASLARVVSIFCAVPSCECSRAAGIAVDSVVTLMPIGLFQEPLGQVPRWWALPCVTAA